MSCFDNSYLNQTSNIDNMLSRFKKDREYVIDLAENNIDKLIVDLWTPASPICFDNKCLFNMGRTQQIYTLEERIEGKKIINETVLNYYTCPQCKNVKRLIDFNQTKIGEPFFIECGESAGQQLIITETAIEKLFILNEAIPRTVEKLMESPFISKLQQCSNGCNVSISDRNKSEI